MFIGIQIIPVITDKNCLLANFSLHSQRADPFPDNRVIITCNHIKDGEKKYHTGAGWPNNDVLNIEMQTSDVLFLSPLGLRVIGGLPGAFVAELPEA